MNTKELKKIAHHLKAEFNIGKEGVSDAFIKSLYQGFKTKELLKVKKLENCKLDKYEIVSALQAQGNIHCIQIIGNVFTLYKEFEEEKE